MEVKKEEQATVEQLDQLTEAKPNDQLNIVQRLQQNTDRFIEKVANYKGSKKQLQAVLASLIVHPFNERPFRFGYPEQKELFDLGVMVSADKLMFLHLGIEEQKIAKDIKDRAEKAQKEETENGKES